MEELFENARHHTGVWVRNELVVLAIRELPVKFKFIRGGGLYSKNAFLQQELLVLDEERNQYVQDKGDPIRIEFVISDELTQDSLSAVNLKFL